LFTGRWRESDVGCPDAQLLDLQHFGDGTLAHAHTGEIAPELIAHRIAKLDALRATDHPDRKEKGRRATRGLISLAPSWDVRSGF